MANEVPGTNPGDATTEPSTNPGDSTIPLSTNPGESTVAAASAPPLPEANAPSSAPPSRETSTHHNHGNSWNPTNLNFGAIQDGLIQNYTDAAGEFNHPHQVDDRHKAIVARVGRVGWVAKGVVYGILGGLACKVAAVGTAGKGIDASPQGAFILVASNAVGYPLLIVMAVGVLLYAIWRCWEAFTGQGYDATYSNLKNFFKFRLSPFISGMVYLAYLVFLLSLLPDVNESPKEKGGSEDQFPASWTGSTIGRIAVGLMGVAFLIATGIQLQAALTKVMHTDYRKDIPRSHRVAILSIGHLGFLGRAGAFLAVAAFFFRSLQHNIGGDGGHTVGESLNQLQRSDWGRPVLFFIGIFLVVYGLFAVLCAYARIFPTPPPSGIRQEHDHNHEHRDKTRELSLLERGKSLLSRSAHHKVVIDE